MESKSNPLLHLKLPSYLGEDTLSGAAGVALRPHLMCDLHYDLFDVRSRVKQSGEYCLAAPVLDYAPEAVLLPEMIVEADRSQLRPCSPVGVTFSVPPFVIDEQLIRQIKDKIVDVCLRYRPLIIFHNTAMGIYSRPPETRLEFVRRCQDLLEEQARRELDQLRLKYERKLERVVHKIQVQYFQFNADDEGFQDGLKSKYKTLIFQTRDELSRLFIDIRDIPDYSRPTMTAGDESQESLEEVYREAWSELNAQMNQIREYAGRVEEYPIFLQYKNVAIHQTAILWKI